MIDLHTHSLLSDGELLPLELARRAEEKGYEIIGITDHVDFSNVKNIVPSLISACEKINRYFKIKAIPGVEITHVHPDSIPEIVKISKELGAKLIVVHGETIVEPVFKGTNRKALECGVDILAHPGILSEEEAIIACEKNVKIEVSARKGHSLSNGHIVKLWYKYKFPLILNSDAHSPDDLITDGFAEKILLSAGVEKKDIEKIFSTSRKLAMECIGRLENKNG